MQDQSKNFMNSVKVADVPYSTFDLSNDVKTAFDMGELVPIMAPLECIPGDKFKISAESIVRFAPTLAPVMHRYDATIHYFFVPNRILWENWEEYITQKNPTQLPAAPYLVLFKDTNQINNLVDYFGIPSGVANFGTQNELVSALPFAAYLKIYDEYYRDQNLCPELFRPLKDGDNTGEFTLDVQYRAWEHDYFTSNLPFAQKGGEVLLPLGTLYDVPVLLNNPSILTPTDLTNSVGYNITVPNLPADINPAAPNINPGDLYADTSALQAQAADINDLRLAFRMQEFLEKMARGGSRYSEVILSHFGIKTSDARLQRPEYITGIKTPIIISEVLNTTGTSTAPQGNMSGHGIGVINGGEGEGYYSVEEHGYILGIMSVMPKTAYMQGIQRTFKKITSPYDYYWPTFANIGEQETLQSEIYAYADKGVVFGYMPRYSEYRTLPNLVTSDMRNSLDFWHSARKFAAPPFLNQSFIECKPDDRIFAVTQTAIKNLWVMVLNIVKAKRPIPKYGTPTF